MASPTAKSFTGWHNLPELERYLTHHQIVSLLCLVAPLNMAGPVAQDGQQLATKRFLYWLGNNELVFLFRLPSHHVLDKIIIMTADA